nr:MAG TPA: hypothetical protein [Caudoviricetes sp.]
MACDADFGRCMGWGEKKMNRELKAYRERKRILEVLGLDESDMVRVYRALGRDEEFIQDMKDVTRALDNRLLAWELRRVDWWLQLVAVFTVLRALVAVIAAW